MNWPLLIKMILYYCKRFLTPVTYFFICTDDLQERGSLERIERSFVREYEEYKNQNSQQASQCFVLCNADRHNQTCYISFLKILSICVVLRLNTVQVRFLNFLCMKALHIYAQLNRFFFSVNKLSCCFNILKKIFFINLYIFTCTWYA